MVKTPIYLDYNATTPCDPAVVDAMIPYFTQHFGNASSRNHPFGWQADGAAEYAREQVAALINAEAGEIVFTSGATESCNMALKGVAEAYASKGDHIITVVTEHKAVLDTCRDLEKKGRELTYLDVSSEGLIDIAALEAAIRPTTILIAVMYANNETGVIQPVREIGAVAKKHGVFFFCDATQAVGKIPLDVQSDGIDMLAFSAHKMYGPKGTGALYVRRKAPRVKIPALVHGGGHERGMRSGTLNTPGIVGFGTAAALAAKKMTEENQRLSALRNRLEQELLEIGEVTVNGSITERLPHVTNLSFRHIEGDALILGFNKEIAVASGSACSSASPEPSYVLKALGLDDGSARSSIRFSLGRFTTGEEIDFVIKKVKETVAILRTNSPLWEQYKEVTTG